MTLSATSGAVTLHAEAVKMGRDLALCLTGGDRPHLGCIALAEPHPPIGGGEGCSATVSVLNCLAHRDGEIAVSVAKALSAALGCRVSVSCGIHFDDFTEKLLENTKIAAIRLQNDLICQLSD